MDLKGKTKDDTKLDTVHQNAITTIRAYDGASGRLAKFSSTLLFSSIVTMLMVLQQVVLMAV
jgi:actin related protein 2/3 complex subunit 1A/1B